MPSRLLWSLLASWLPFAALAAEPSQIHPNPADPGAAAAPLHYRSAFSSDLRPQQPPRGDWRQANDRVRAVGGFAGALKDDLPATAEPHRHGDKQPQSGHQHAMPGHTMHRQQMPGHPMPDHGAGQPGMHRHGARPQDGQTHDGHKP